MSLPDVKNAEEVRKHAFTIALSLSWPLFGAICLLSGVRDKLRACPTLLNAIFRLAAAAR